MKQFSQFGIAPSSKGLIGKKIDIDEIFDKEIVVERFEIRDSKYDKGNGKCLYLQIEFEHQKRVVFSGSGILMDEILKIQPEDFPFATRIKKDYKRHIFS